MPRGQCSGCCTGGSSCGLSTGSGRTPISIAQLQQVMRAKNLRPNGDGGMGHLVGPTPPTRSPSRVFGRIVTGRSRSGSKSPVHSVSQAEFRAYDSIRCRASSGLLWVVPAHRSLSRADESQEQRKAAPAAAERPSAEMVRQAVCFRATHSALSRTRILIFGQASVRR